MREISLSAKKREMKGTRGSRKVRNQDFIPAILYGEGKVSIPLQLAKKDVQDIIRKRAWESVIIDLKLQGEDEVNTVIIKELQISPIKRDILHIDLCKISLKEKTRVHVHIEVVGESPGIKNNGGILQHITREIEIECLPKKIPETIKVDISSLEIGDAILAKDLKVSEDIKIITDQERVIINIISPTVLEEKVEEKTPLASAAEPEVIAKGKKEEVEE